MNAWPQAFGVQDRMSWTVWVPEVLREFRFLTSSPATCPWGFIALVVLLTFCCGCLAGGCAAAAIFSNQCRRLGLGILRVCVQSFGPVHSPLDLQGRLAEYQHRH